MKRILHIQKVEGVAGSERHLLALLPKLDRERFRVGFLMIGGAGEVANAYLDALKRNGVPACRIHARADVDPVLLAQMVCYIRRGGFDLVHTHLVHADLYGLLAARAAGVTHVVSTRHNDDAFRENPVMRPLIRAASRRCARVITISHHLAEFVRRVEGLAPERITTIHYGLPARDGRGRAAETVRAALAIADRAPLAVSVGRLTEQKGHRYLLEAWRLVSQVLPDARLLIVGEGPLRRPLTELSRRVGIAGTVRFTGWRDDVSDLLAAADVYVHPSLWEGFGLVLLEAMAAGRCVIASQVSAIPEIVVDRETGLLVPPRNARALAETLEELLREPDRRQRMGEAGRERVRQRFTVERMVKATEAIYEEVFAKAGHGG